MFRKRKPKGSPDGGQFAPDMRGKDVPAASDLDTVLSEAEWDPSWGLKEYAERTDVAFQLYQEQVKRRAGLEASLMGQYGGWAQHACSVCGEPMLRHALDCKMRRRDVGGYIGGDRVILRESNGAILEGFMTTDEDPDQVDRLQKGMAAGRVVGCNVSIVVKDPGSRVEAWRRPRVSGDILMAWSGAVGRQR